MRDCKGVVLKHSVEIYVVRSFWLYRATINCLRICYATNSHTILETVLTKRLKIFRNLLVVSQNQKALHIVFPHQFLDSPEWFGVSTDDYFQVSIMAMEESRVLIWHRDKLKLSIMAEPFLQAVFDHILGRDVVKKLMQVTQIRPGPTFTSPSDGRRDQTNPVEQAD
ncbi:conserved hypothetical protein [Culex quinquefasciatus]|uniref:Blood vessel epicardial substance n=1 Tax=Culex quinquefasciatus TaxID=7176 RepID=B0WWD3_CULQU|nr:conserved hypothetical protein [Culex quinquefasciatus]|eukprot:XP_001861705.1 conserved hypothetical protein [Culex quinquefasciatus]